MNAAEDQIALRIVFEVRVEFRDEFDTFVLVCRFVRREGHAENGHAERKNGIGDCRRDIFVTGRHAVERAMRLDVIERDALRHQETP